MAMAMASLVCFQIGLIGPYQFTEQKLLIPVFDYTFYATVPVFAGLIFTELNGKQDSHFLVFITRVMQICLLQRCLAITF